MLAAVMFNFKQRGSRTFSINVVVVAGSLFSASDNDGVDSCH